MISRAKTEVEIKPVTDTGLNYNVLLTHLPGYAAFVNNPEILFLSFIKSNMG